MITTGSNNNLRNDCTETAPRMLKRACLLLSAVYRLQVLSCARHEQRHEDVTVESPHLWRQTFGADDAHDAHNAARVDLDQ